MLPIPEISSTRRPRILFLGFVVLLAAPTISWVLRCPEPADVPDMRTLAAWPDWHATPVARRPAAFETWLNDHFPLRGWIIRWHSLVQYRLLHAAASNVVVGPHDWLFYVGDRTLEDLRGQDPLSETQLKAWRDGLEGRRAWLNEHHIAYLFVVVPNKSTVHFEELPWLLRLQRHPGKLDQLIDYLHQHSTVPILDLRDSLFALKAQGRPAYWPGDTHWNGEGLVTAYEAIMARLQQMGAAHRAPDDTARMKIELVPRNFDCVDMIAMRGHWPDFPTPVLKLAHPVDLRESVSLLTAVAPWKDEPSVRQPVAYERASGSGRAVLLCDSFFRFGGVPFEALSQTPFLLSFHRFVSVWDRSDFAVLNEIVKKEHPDVVIEQTTERFLGDPPGDAPELAQARARQK